MSRKIGDLWIKTSKDGKKYMSGVLEDLSGDIRIAVFKNDRKEKDSHPDYQILLSEDRKDQQRQETPRNENSGGNEGDGIRLEDIPF